MTTYKVEILYSGAATIEVDADDEKEAESVARNQTCGFVVEGGNIDYMIESVEEA
jgi:hypothetical protein